MRRTSISYFLVLATVACGGVAAADKSSKPSQPDDGTGAGGMLGIAGAAGFDMAGAGGLATEPPVNQIEVVDDVDQTDGRYPAVPPGSSAFFWRKGLGNWFVSFSDGSGGHDASVDQIIPPRGASSKAYHVGSPAPGVAIDLWAQLDHLHASAVDLSGYFGISFWARKNNPSAELTVAFGADGKFFNPGPGTPWPQQALPISADWTQVTVLFEHLNLNVKAVSSIDLVATSGAEPLDLWVDDLVFLCRGACP